MYEGKIVFAQLMEQLPQHSFRRCVERFGGDWSVKSFSCQDQFRCMAFALSMILAMVAAGFFAFLGIASLLMQYL